MTDRLFRAHPRSLGMSWASHGVGAIKIGTELIGAGCAAMVHAIVPGLFTDTARAMHSGEIETAQVHGNATLEQAKSLLDEGVPVAPLPLPVTPPNQVN